MSCAFCVDKVSPNQSLRTKTDIFFFFVFVRGFTDELFVLSRGSVFLESLPLAWQPLHDDKARIDKANTGKKYFITGSLQQSNSAMPSLDICTELLAPK